MCVRMMREKVCHYSLNKEPGRQQVDILSISDAQVRLMVRTGEKIGNPEYYLGVRVLEGRSRNRIVLQVTEELVAQHDLV
jgi:hypothetical protein